MPRRAAPAGPRASSPVRPGRRSASATDLAPASGSSAAAGRPGDRSSTVDGREARNNYKFDSRSEDKSRSWVGQSVQRCRNYTVSPNVHGGARPWQPHPRGGPCGLSPTPTCLSLRTVRTQPPQTRVTRTQRIVDARTVHELPRRIRRAQQSPYASCERSSHEIVIVHRQP